MNIDKLFDNQKLRNGRMMSGSKISPKGHICVWNANIVTKSQGKIWFGDLDLTLDGKKLKLIADQIGEPLYVLREMDCRFETTNDSTDVLIEKAVWSTDVG